MKLCRVVLCIIRVSECVDMSGMKGEAGRREGEEEEVECAWQEVHDEASRRPLFFNKSTGVTTFEKPDELKSIDERKRVSDWVVSN